MGAMQVLLLLLLFYPPLALNLTTQLLEEISSRHISIHCYLLHIPPTLLPLLW